MASHILVAFLRQFCEWSPDLSFKLSCSDLQGFLKWPFLRLQRIERQNNTYKKQIAWRGKHEFEIFIFISVLTFQHQQNTSRNDTAHYIPQQTPLYLFGMSVIIPHTSCLCSISSIPLFKCHCESIPPVWYFCLLIFSTTGTTPFVQTDWRQLPTLVSLS